ncbi:hypothetical protein [Tautonia plasticadhaerens]|uniref:Uncharacterized protein n=1 Tax=Tautonia plasticadhaerens TaxID=2527974 RepID=A0A518H7K3_9BACT|nr:hypothetical protein [Tautonia plasticadhaerens]QDV36822.1 hypothetical protein ElP_47510 [Tautonia plasticadhaerens]
MPEPERTPGTGASRQSSRLGPSLSLLGLACWVVTIALYLMLKPEEAMPGDPVSRPKAIQVVLVFVVGSLGVFLSSIVAAVGLFLSLTEQRFHPGRRAVRGIVLGAVGVAALVLVVAEILRIAFLKA